MRWTLRWRLQRDGWSSCENADYERGCEEEVRQALIDLEKAHALCVLMNYSADDELPTTYTGLHHFVEWAHARLAKRR